MSCDDGETGTFSFLDFDVGSKLGRSCRAKKEI